MVCKCWKKEMEVTSCYPLLLFEVPSIFMASMSLKRIQAKSSLFFFWKNYQLVAGGSIWDILDLNIIKVFVANDIRLSLLQRIKINEKKKKINCLPVSHSLIHSKTWDELTIFLCRSCISLCPIRGTTELPVF